MGRLLGKKIFLVCSDPGAAQVVLLLYKPLVAEGAFVDVITRNAGQQKAEELGITIQSPATRYRDITRHVQRERPDFIITGTSLKDNLERYYIKAGKSLSTPTLAVIDWWTNFRERFVHTRTNELCLPDWVTLNDWIALKSFRRHFGKKAKTLVASNPYFVQSVKHPRLPRVQQRKLKHALHLNIHTPTVLFVGEPTYPKLPHDQFEVFEAIMKKVSAVGRAHKKQFSIIVKLHPLGQHRSVFYRFSGILNLAPRDCVTSRILSNEYPIHDLIDTVDYVWGLNSAPLLEALIRGKLVSSFLSGMVIDGLPFLKKARYCPSVDHFDQIPQLVEDLLIDKFFVRDAKKKQKAYRWPKGNFSDNVLSVIASEVRA